MLKPQMCSLVEENRIPQILHLYLFIISYEAETSQGVLAMEHAC